jgi:glycosyltransferase involved in cell wall biosynthesis
MIVDDSGKPHMVDNLDGMFDSNENVEVIHLSQNLGQHVATFIGILKSDTGDVVTIDEDLKFSPEALSLLFKAKEQNDVVYGFTPRGGSSEIFREFVLGIAKPMLSNQYPIRTSSFRLISTEMVRGLQQLRPRYIQMEGMLIQNAKRFGYVDVEDGTDDERRGGYNPLSLYLMVSGLFTHYTLIPWIGISVIILGLLPFAGPVELWQLAGLGLLSIFATINIYGEVKNMLLNRAVKRELKGLSPF